MSHFTVLVIGDDIEAALAPFQENNMGDCPRQYMEFHDVEDEYRKEYAEDSREMIVLTDGSRHSPCDNRFKNPAYSPFSSDKDVPQWIYPEGSEKRDFPHRELYTTFDAFITDWAGYKRDPEIGRYGYWENQNRKWDWYQVGGRWSGLLKLKPGAQGLTGERGLMGSHFAEGSDRADQARKRDIDFDGMRADEEAKARERWTHCRNIVGNDLWESWEHVREVRHKGDIKAAREFYRNQPAIAKLRESDRDRYGWDTDDKLTWSLDNYIQHARDKAGVTFALLHEGKWYERGTMGWWACVSNEKPDGQWEREFSKLLDGLPDDAMLTVVDCHI